MITHSQTTPIPPTPTPPYRPERGNRERRTCDRQIQTESLPPKLCAIDHLVRYKRQSAIAPDSYRRERSAPRHNFRGYRATRSQMGRGEQELPPRSSRDEPDNSGQLYCHPIRIRHRASKYGLPVPFSRIHAAGCVFQPALKNPDRRSAAAGGRRGRDRPAMRGSSGGT
jgi:hypothetical protein